MTQRITETPQRGTEKTNTLCGTQCSSVELCVTKKRKCLCNKYKQQMELNKITEVIIGCAIKVHRALGPGLLESAYEECLCYELTKTGFRFERQKPVPIIYEEVRLECGYRMDLLVEKMVVVELKAIDTINPVHEAQILTHMKFSEKTLGLLINFNVTVLKNGIRRFRR